MRPNRYEETAAGAKSEADPTGQTGAIARYPSKFPSYPLEGTGAGLKAPLVTNVPSGSCNELLLMRQLRMPCHKKTLPFWMESGSSSGMQERKWTHQREYLQVRNTRLQPSTLMIWRVRNTCSHNTTLLVLPAPVDHSKFSMSAHSSHSSARCRSICSCLELSMLMNPADSDRQCALRT